MIVMILPKVFKYFTTLAVRNGARVQNSSASPLLGHVRYATPAKSNKIHKFAKAPITTGALWEPNMNTHKT